ncbi:MAG: DMT family transporter [Solirubrobacteraceae bacterium]
MAWGALGTLVFSFTLPATRVAVEDLDGAFVGLGRAVVAGLLALAVILVLREPLPARRHRRGLVLVAVGVVFGFPLCTSLALEHLESAHSAVIVGLLPAATAVMAVLRAGERPSRAFWLASLAGLAAVLVFASIQGAGSPRPADGLVLAAVAFGALGYAEGANLAREIGGWRVICWALIGSLPVLVATLAVTGAARGVSAGTEQWLGFAYVAVFSAFLGFFPWYRGLAQGGVARIGQLQLAQPVLTVAWSALLLGEDIGVATVVAALAVLACVGLTQRTRVARAPAPPG